MVHYIGYEGYEGSDELYDLANDPEELEDLASTQREMAMELLRELETKLREADQAFRGD